jgi:hypothetical protein
LRTVYGHGPYWYLIVPGGYRPTRVYIGKTLDTQRYVRDDGEVDWAAIKAMKKERKG